MVTCGGGKSLFGTVYKRFRSIRKAIQLLTQQLHLHHEGVPRGDGDSNKRNTREECITSTASVNSSLEKDHVLLAHR